MTQPHPTTNQNWFRIRYDTTAAEGLPPVIQAEQVVRYADATGTWVVALWAPSDASAVSACILRVPAEQVLAVTRHSDLTEAVGRYLFDR